MIKLILISALLFSFNSWAADDDLPADGLFRQLPSKWTGKTNWGSNG